MGLPWIRLDVNTFDHPKMLELLDRKRHKAVVGHLAAMTYSGKHGLDGFIPKSALRAIGVTSTDVKDLMQVDLWHAAEGGWDIHGWKEYQMSSEEHEERRRRMAERGRRGAEKRWGNGE
jgi:hypothetical protein